MKGLKSIVSLGLGLGLLVYAVPRLQTGQGWTLPTIFSVAWLCMMLLIIGAHLHDLIVTDEGRKREAERIKRYRKWQLQQRFGKMKHLKGND